MSEGPTVLKVGLGYQGHWQAEHQTLTVGLTRLRVHDGDVGGILAVSNGRHLLRGRFNTGSIPTRASTAKTLASRASSIPEGVWRDILEEFCVAVMLADEAGPPRETIGGGRHNSPHTYLHHPILPQGVPTMLYGRPSAGKSTLAVAVALSVQTGQPVIPDWKPQQANVLVLDWESGVEDWNGRLLMVARGAGLEAPPIHYRRCAGRLADLVDPLAAQVTEDNIGLVVIDSATPAEGSSGDRGGMAEGTHRLYEAVHSIGATTLLIGQMSRHSMEDSEGTTAPPYGSVFHEYECRSMWFLQAEEEPQAHVRDLALKHYKFNNGPLSPTQGVRIRYSPGSFVFERCPVTDPKSMPLPDRIVDFLVDETKPQKPSDIATALGVRNDLVRSALAKGKGTRFERNKYGRWRMLTYPEDRW